MPGVTRGLVCREDTFETNYAAFMSAPQHPTITQITRLVARHHRDNTDPNRLLPWPHAPRIATPTCDNTFEAPLNHGTATQRKGDTTHTPMALV